MHGEDRGERDQLARAAPGAERIDPVVIVIRRPMGNPAPIHFGGPSLPKRGRADGYIEGRGERLVGWIPQPQVRFGDQIEYRRADLLRLVAPASIETQQ